MKITQWDIKGFGKLKQLKSVPGSGFNIIYAPNESGKSTLQAFVRAMLYGQRGGRKAKDGTLPPLKHYRPWNSDSYAGVMEYTLADGRSFRVGRNFEKGTTNLYDGGANQINASFPQDKETGPRFAEVQLALDEVSFERTAFIRQLQCAVDEAGRKSLIEKLSNLNSAGHEDLSLTKAVAALESAVLEKVGTGRSSVRPLDKVNIRMSELERKKQELLERNERYLDTALVLHDKKQLLTALLCEKEIKAAREEGLKKAKLFKLNNEMEELSKALASNEEELKACTLRLRTLEAFSQITDEDLSQAALLFHDWDQVEEALNEEAAALEELEQRHEALRSPLDKEEVYKAKTLEVDESLKVHESYQVIDQSPVSRKVSPFVYIGGFLTLASIVAFLLTGQALFLGITLLGGLLSGGFLLLGAKKAAATNDPTFDSRALNESLSAHGFINLAEYLTYKESQLKGRTLLEQNGQKILEGKKRKEDLSLRINTLESKVEEISSKWPDAQSTDKRNFLDEIKRGVDDLKRERMYQNGLLERKSKLSDKLELLLREAGILSGRTFKDPKELKEIVEGFSPVQSEEQEYLQDSQTKALDELENRITGLKLEITALNTRLEQAPQENELALIDEEWGQLQLRKQKLQKIGASLTLASQILKETALSLQRDYVPALNQEMSRFLEKLTRGKYTRVMTNDTFQVQLAAPETDELVTVDRLSGGTVDQVFLAMRLAMVHLLEKNSEPLPLFLDEPFLQYDEDRSRSAFELLKEISEERQIFFFTCREKEYTLAQEIFKGELNQIAL